MEPDFKTDRLWAWRQEVAMPNGNCNRVVYIAVCTDMDWPGVAVSCCVCGRILGTGSTGFRSRTRFADAATGRN